MSFGVSSGAYLPLVTVSRGDVDSWISLSDNPRAREALRQCLPEPLRDATFSSVLRDDAATKRCLAQLLINLSDCVAE
jgi:CCR4-NOT transcription complex subunit 9